MLFYTPRLCGPDGRYARRKLHVVDVIQGKLLFPEVKVQVDHARHHVLAVTLDDPVTA